MNKGIASVTLTGLLVFSFGLCAIAGEWGPVASKGFGNPNNDYAWSMASFRGYLYVGTMNPLNGAQIWRSRTGEAGTWKRVYRAPTLLTSGIRCLYADGNRALYAGTFGFLGGRILRSTDGQMWLPVGKWGFGDLRNISIRCMARFGDYLYAGTGGSDTPDLTGRDTAEEPSPTYGAQLYRSRNGFIWERVNADPDFRSTKVFDPSTNSEVINNINIGELAVFGGRLYAFTWTKDISFQSGADSATQKAPETTLPDIAGPDFPTSAGAFEVWRSSNGVTWEKVVGKDDPYGNGMGFSLRDPDPDNMENDVVTSVAVFKDKLYLGTENTTGKTAVWRTDDGQEWTKVLDFYVLGERFNFYVWRMIAYNDTLFVGTMNMGPVEIPGVTGGQIWASCSGDISDFHNIVHNGFDGESIDMGDIWMPKNYGVRSFGIINGSLFAGTATIPSIPMLGSDLPWDIPIAGKDVGCEVWKIGLGNNGPTPFYCPPAADRVDIKINGSDGPLSVSSDTPVSVAVYVNSGEDEGRECDLWVAVNTPFPPPLDWYSCRKTGQWQLGVYPWQQIAIFDPPEPIELLDTALLPGRYIFYFGADDLDGLADGPWLGLDSVTLEVQ